MFKGDRLLSPGLLVLLGVLWLLGKVVGIKEWRSLFTASLTGGSIGVVLTVLVGKD